MSAPSREALRLFSEGACFDAYTFLGCHREAEGLFAFRVWAPCAQSVFLVTEKTGWRADGLAMHRLEEGIWEITGIEANIYDEYKFRIVGADGVSRLRCDPYAVHCGMRPDLASKVYPAEEIPGELEPLSCSVPADDPLSRPISIYEVHLGSWRTHEDGSPLTYNELADELLSYVKEMGYTHIELLPVAEYPFDPSWGYQVTGYYAPTNRYGTPGDFRAFVNRAHELGIGVILDWVGAHFPRDMTGLFEYDGSCLYEYADPLMREHPDWGTRIFDYGKGGVVSFLVSNAVYWLREYGVDGLRADAVASMLYLDYGRKPGQWHPNADGGNINRDAFSLLQKLNRAAYAQNPHVLMCAEESTAFPMVTKPDFDGGLGFTLKWNMGWMNDMLSYMSADPIHRSGMHNKLTFSLTYAFSENFILPLSHDEVVHGKCSMLSKMPGEYDMKFAGLRLLYAYMYAHPGKKLSFMGNEFGQFIEWNFAKGLDWLLLGYDMHRVTKDYTKALNSFYVKNPPLWEDDAGWNGFQWIAADDTSQSVVSFRRIDRSGQELICIFNFCPVLREDYRIGLPEKGAYRRVFSTADPRYGSKSDCSKARVSGAERPLHGLPCSGIFRLPPMSALFYRKITDKTTTNRRKQTCK